MKKIIGVILVFVLAVVILSTSTVFADSIGKTVEIFYNNIKISFDGEELVPADANGNTVEPFIMNGTTYLPVRAVANMVGLYVDWDSENNTVILSTTEIVKTVGISDAVNYEKDIVPTEMSKNMGWTADGLKHKVRVPKIDSDSAGAAEFNKKIYSEFSAIVDELKSNGESGTIYKIDYSYKVHNGLAGIAIKQQIGAQMGGSSVTELIFYYDLNSDRELTFSEYLSALGVDTNDLQVLLRQMDGYEYEAQGGSLQISDCILDDKSTVIYYSGGDSMFGVSSYEAKPLF